jgi:hypothetical protein
MQNIKIKEKEVEGHKHACVLYYVLILCMMRHG